MIWGKAARTAAPQPHSNGAASGDAHMAATSELECDMHDLHVEVCLKSSSNANPADIKALIERRMGPASVKLTGDLHAVVCQDDPMLAAHVASIRLADVDPELLARTNVLHYFQKRLHVHVYQLNEEGGEDDDEGEDGVVSYREWQLPAADFEGSWDALYYDSAIKRRLLQYASSALLFSDLGVNTQLISWNRVVLLHGPPGTGKTSLCKALAHKLSIRLADRYTTSQLVEVNAHSLFSKWFSESGKLVSKLFGSIAELVEEPHALVFVLIDEVESLTAARKAAASGGEPSDAIRAVNALLTQLDQLRRFPNVMVLTTSNITEAIDVAFVDRADIKAYLGPPSAQARYEILRSGMLELARAGLIADVSSPQQLMSYKALELLPAASRSSAQQQGGIPAAAVLDGSSSPQQAAAEACSLALWRVVGACEGFSGRTLRKLPFLAHATADALPFPCGCVDFLEAMAAAAERTRQERSELTTG